MNHGPLVFLAAFFALAASWIGFVLTPQMQVGQLQQTNAVANGPLYPLGRSGLARQGLEVYRANGCAYCHSQQVVQTGTACDVLLTDPGTNQAAMLAALDVVKKGISEAEAKVLLSSGSKPVLQGVDVKTAEAAAKTLNTNGAKAQVWVVATGPDISRGWGKRRTVARDFVFDSPVMLGSQRVGPDLANVGMRQPDLNWHLRHFYAPASEVKGSSMPPYRFLFQRRRIEQKPSPDALPLPPEIRGGNDFEVIPSPEALALAAYMISLRADAPLFEAPFSMSSSPSSAAATNTSSSASGAASPPPVNVPPR